MPKKSDQPLEVVPVRLYVGDAARLRRYYTIGANAVIRELVRAHIRKVEETIAQTYPPPVTTIDQLDLNLEPTDE
jgi:hypothetical protein